MKIFVGLGNPGKKYENTRHNAGFILIDAFCEENGGVFSFDRKFNAEIAKVIVDEEEMLLVKPQTFMNNSGESVSKILNYFNASPEELLVIHDDVDLEFGQTKLQFDRGSAGHKGVQNVIDMLGTQEFWRFRVGVGKSSHPEIGTEKWTLMDFSEEELSQVKNIKIPTQIS